MGLVPSDTDYRMFSYATLGKWPGIDVAFILDSATYHTSRDKLQRLQHGACQVRRRQAVGVQCADAMPQRLPRQHAQLLRGTHCSYSMYACQTAPLQKGACQAQNKGRLWGACEQGLQSASTQAAQAMGSMLSCLEVVA